MGKVFITTHHSPRAHGNKVKLDIITAEQEEETCSTEASVSPWAKPMRKELSSELSTRMMVPTSFPSAC